MPPLSKLNLTILSVLTAKLAMTSDQSAPSDSESRASCCVSSPTSGWSCDLCQSHWCSAHQGQHPWIDRKGTLLLDATSIQQYQTYSVGIPANKKTQICQFCYINQESIFMDSWSHRNHTESRIVGSLSHSARLCQMNLQFSCWFCNHCVVDSAWFCAIRWSYFLSICISPWQMPSTHLFMDSSRGLSSSTSSTSGPWQRWELELSQLGRHAKIGQTTIVVTVICNYSNKMKCK